MRGQKSINSKGKIKTTKGRNREVAKLKRTRRVRYTKTKSETTITHTPYYVCDSY